MEPTNLKDGIELLNHFTLGDVSKDVLTGFLIWQIFELRKDFHALNSHIKITLDIFSDIIKNKKL